MARKLCTKTDVQTPWLINSTLPLLLNERTLHYYTYCTRYHPLPTVDLYASLVTARTWSDFQSWQANFRKRSLCDGIFLLSSQSNSLVILINTSTWRQHGIWRDLSTDTQHRQYVSSIPRDIIPRIFCDPLFQPRQDMLRGAPARADFSRFIWKDDIENDLERSEKSYCILVQSDVISI